ncbi:MAG: glycosyltransferase [Verrucomicrobiota bacterium]|jgi:glycosyltransferase involved in cell wall biosynthesis|nr:glycosyltransferase [Verrucomicrobiota bacterium]
MNVVFLLQDTRVLYGAEKAALRLVEGLVAAGVSVHVLLLRETRLGGGGSELSAAFERVAPVSSIPVSGRLSRAAMLHIRAAMTALRGDLLHSTGYKADVHALWASQKCRLFPVVGTVHGWLFRWQLKERLYQALHLLALRRFSRVIALSRFYERYLRRHGLHPLQLALIPTGIRPEEVAPRAEARRLWDSPADVFTFGMLGRLSSEKNHRMLLHAAARLAQDLDTSPRPWRIFIAGDGPLRSRLEKTARRLGLDDRVCFAGRLDSADFFRRVHVLVQCSRVENQSMSVMEAMAWMRPVLATRSGGLPEQVLHGETGRLLPRRRIRPLARALKEYVIAPAKAQADGLRARAHVEAAYPFDAMIREHIGLYDAEIAMHRRRLMPRV